MAPHRSLLPAAVAALVLFAPFGQAAYSFGTIVDKNDSDFQPELSIRSTTPGASPMAKFFLPCYVDENGDGKLSIGEALYLAVRVDPDGSGGPIAAPGCGRVAAKDVRLTPVGSFAAGTVVKGSVDADHGTMMAKLGASAADPGHAIRSFDLAPDFTVKKVDSVYLDLVRFTSAMPTVDVGDLRLTPVGNNKAGSYVKSGDEDLNSALSNLYDSATPPVAAMRSLYTTAIVYEYGKSWYLNNDMDAATKGVEEGDVRLTAGATNIMGDVMANLGNPGPVGDGITFSKKTVGPGEMFQVYVQVRNPTVKVGSALVETSLDGALVDARGTPTLVQNEVQTLVISLIAPTTPGQHKVTSADYTGFFEVSAPAAPVTTQAPATTAPAIVETASVVKQSAPGAAPVAMLGLLVLALVALRRRIE